MTLILNLFMVKVCLPCPSDSVLVKGDQEGHDLFNDEMNEDECGLPLHVIKSSGPDSQYWDGLNKHLSFPPINSHGETRGLVQNFLLQLLHPIRESMHRIKRGKENDETVHE